MLGFYNNFPVSVHKIVVFSASISTKRLQKALVGTLGKLNNGTYTLEEVATPSIPECRIIFEFGVAEDNDFNYLDDEERIRLIKAIERKPFSTMDFLCVVRYYKLQNERKTPLKFDYYMLRFTFSKESVAMQVFHEKGLMYVSPKDLPGFVAEKINSEFSKKALKIQQIS